MVLSDRIYNIYTNPRYGTQFSREGFVRKTSYDLQNDETENIALAQFAENSTIGSALRGFYSPIEANPSNPSCAKALDHVFVNQAMPNVDDLLIANELVDDQDGELIFQIEKAIVENDRTFLLGEKGAGKTFFMNYWLTQRTRPLEKKHNIVWFRIDCSKLYEHWNNGANAEKMNIQAYHIAHTAYVLYMYGALDPASDSLSEIYERMKSDSHNDIDFINADKTLSEYVQVIKQSEEKHSKVNSSVAFLHYTLDRVELKEACSKVYLAFMIARRALNYDILFIVDGLDNIVWRPNSNNMEELERQIKKYAAGDGGQGIDYDKFLISMRPETYEEKFQHNFTPPFESPIIKLHVASPEFNSVVVHRKEVARAGSKSRDYFRLHLKKIIRQVRKEVADNKNAGEDNLPRSELKITSEAIKTLWHKVDKSNNFLESYLMNISSALIERYKKIDDFSQGLHYASDSFDTPDNVLRKIFKGNLRTALSNAIEACVLSEFCENKGDRGVDHPDRRLEYMLLSGRAFLDTPSTMQRKAEGMILSREPSQAFPNILWWDFNNNQTVLDWPGLCCIRVLQTLTASVSKCASILISDLVALFNYPQGLVEDSVIYLANYSAISIGNPVTLEHELTKEIKGFDFCLDITPKGKFLLDCMSVYPEWLYFCALDTYLPKSIQDKLSSHRSPDDYTRFSSFNPPFVKTALTILRLVVSQDNSDRRMFLSKVEENQDKVFHLIGRELDFLAFSEIYTLPKSFVFATSCAIEHFVNTSTDSEHPKLDLLDYTNGILNMDETFWLKNHEA